MSSTPDTLLADAQIAALSQRRRVSEVRAREHVGAAGWAQASTLEAIIRAGQEGLVATEALRQVVSLTGEQLRTLPLSTGDRERAGHAATLQNVLHSGEDQLTVAHTVNDLVCRALDEVASTPVAEISTQRLRAIQSRVLEQVEALGAIIASAQAQADTLEQVQKLDEVIAEHQLRISALREYTASAEAEALAGAGEQIVQRIGELDEAAPKQIEALSRIGEAVAERVGDTGADARKKAEALEELAETMTGKARDIRKEG
nr:hypothetical protein [Deinococcus koreensis]